MLIHLPSLFFLATDFYQSPIYFGHYYIHVHYVVQVFTAARETARVVFSYFKNRSLIYIMKI